MDDSEIINLFFERSEKAVTELSVKYGGACIKVASNILGNHEDAEECINDAYLGVWNAIPPKKPDSLIAFVLRIVRNISIDKYKYYSTHKRNRMYEICLDELSKCISGNETVETELDAKEMSESIDCFIDTLDETNRMLFVRRYWYFDTGKELSGLLGMTEGNVRVRLSRLRNELKKYLESRG